MSRVRHQYQAARWDEPLIYELGSPGERSVFPPSTESGIREVVGDPLADLPKDLRRSVPLDLPEISEPQVLRHYTRLSQMCLGVDVAVDMTGTCTMKYSPKINELITRKPEMSELHPSQAPATMQGLLEIVHRLAEIVCEISGLDAATFQPAGGSQGIFANACIIRAYHEARGEGSQRDEIITTSFSHPADPAAASTAGFKVITLMPGPKGYATLDSLEAVLSERTAGLMITNPEDTGLFNPEIDQFVKRVHEIGGLCAYDQANANGLLGITRAGDIGFDLCQFNLHKTFSGPHSSNGQACAAICVSKELSRFLPRPVVAYDGQQYQLEDPSESIGKIRGYMGNLQVVVKAYTWIRSLGPDGLKAVAQTAVLNSNYIARKLSQIPGFKLPYDPTIRRLEQVRYSLAPLKEETGVGGPEMKMRMIDFGQQHIFESHHPVLVPEPATIEPGESYSLDEIDEYLAVLQEVAREARVDASFVASGPHRSAQSRADDVDQNGPDTWAMTWHARKRKPIAVDG